MINITDKYMEIVLSHDEFIEFCINFYTNHFKQSLTTIFQEINIFNLKNNIFIFAYN